MVATRARKRRAQQLESDNTNDDDQQSTTTTTALDADPSSFEEADLALEEAALVRKKKNKQRRIESFERNHPPFEMLPALALETIMLFLDNPRDVYNISSCAKYIRDCLTPEIVIRSAVFGGGKSKMIASDLMDSVDRKTIHVPSTLRLLRLVNAKSCERGNQCYAFDLVNKKPGAICPKNTNIDLPFGLSICPTCAKSASCPVRSHCSATDRLEYCDSRILFQPYKEAVTDEPAGPLLLALPVKQIEATYPYRANNTEEDKKKRKEAFDRLFESIDQDMPQDSDHANAIVEAYKAAAGEYDSFVNAKSQLALKKSNDKHAERSNKRMENARAVYKQFDSLLSDDNYEHKDLVLSCTWTDEGYCLFDYLPVDTILGGLVRAPSKATKKNVASAIEKARRVMDKIHAYGFSPESAPSGLTVLASRPEKHVKFVVRFFNQLATYMQKIILNPQVSAYLQLNPARSSTVGRMQNFVRLVEDDKPFDAFLQLLIHDALEDDIGLNSMIFTRIVRERDASQQRKLKSLARKIWGQHFTRYNRDDYNTEESFAAKFAVCFSTYRSLHLSIRAYLSDANTIAFLAETGPPAHSPNQHFTRQKAVDKMYTNDHCIRFLRARNFRSLLSLHRAYFQNPSYYDF